VEAIEAQSLKPLNHLSLNTLAFRLFQRCQQHFGGWSHWSPVLEEHGARKFVEVDVVSDSDVQTSQVSLSRILFLSKFTQVWSLSLEARLAKKRTFRGTLLYQMKVDNGWGTPHKISTFLEEPWVDGTSFFGKHALFAVRHIWKPDAPKKGVEAIKLTHGLVREAGTKTIARHDHKWKWM
jgi:hypothetical protein